MSLPDPNKLTVTIGVKELLAQNGGSIFPLDKAVYEGYKNAPDEDLTGGEDKRFFTFMLYDTKLFAAENEVGGFTVMLPEEY